MTTLLTLAALVVIGEVFSAALLQQQASAAANHNKCSGDIITCTHNKKTHHSTKDSTPFDLPITEQRVELA